MPYYPEVATIQGLVRVIRERRLPSEAVPRPTHTISNAPVEAMQVILEGDVYREFRIIDVGAALKARRKENVADMIEVDAGQQVQFGHELARRGRGRRARVLHSPADGLIVLAEDRRIILQVSERAIEIQAKIPGQVQEVEPHLVRIAGSGALIQCAWGNGGFCYEAFRFLPEEGFVKLSKLDVSISEYRQMVIISPYPINKGDLLVAQQQEVAGVVAPSMSSDLREFAMGLKFPVILTEGFGQRRPTTLIYTLLQSNMGRQAAFNAAAPDRWSWERPEIMIPLPTGGSTPPTPALDQALQVGAQVRMTRAPWDGLTGEVVELPPAPQVIESGLRLPCARVQLADGQARLIPLANIEVVG
ncbi:MAG: hypothetical protein GYB65_14660 [Chloroflexi bacterium]|nr:hypothetical protein [Chloroflexota bacterium]